MKYILVLCIFLLLIITIQEYTGLRAENNKKPKHPASYYIKEGNNFFSNRKFKEAIDAYTEAIKQEPTARYLMKRAEVYQLSGEYEFALNDIHSILKVENENKRAQRLNIKLSLLLGKFKEAFDFVTPLKSTYSEEYKNVKNAYEMMNKLNNAYGAWDNINNPKDCVNLAQELLVTASESFELRIIRIRCGLASRSFSVVSSEVKKIFKLHPSNTEVLALYGEYLYQLGVVDQAKDTLGRCLQTDPDNKYCMATWKRIKKAERMIIKAQIKEDEKKYGDAIRMYEKYLVFVKDAHVYNEHDIMLKVCKLHVTARTVSEGLKACDRLIEIGESEVTKSTIADAHFEKVELYILEDDLDGARDELNKAEGILEGANQRVQELRQKLHRLERMASRKDYYKILGVSRSATKRDIKNAFRKLTRKHHPDRVQDPEKKKKAEKKFQEINEAYELLKDDEKRRRFDNGEDPNDPHGGQQGGFHNAHFQGGGFPFNFHFGGGGQGGFPF